MTRRSLCSALFFAVATAAGCNSKADDVCENVAACENGGSSEQVQSCQDEAKVLRAEADAGGCSGAYDGYYACADSKFTCEGATASFPGCDGERATLDACLARGAATNACGELARKTSACHTIDGGASAPLSACTAARACAARCYLDRVADPCAPRPDELSASASCTQSCPR
jgi:hypothetical protein